MLARLQQYRSSGQRVIGTLGLPLGLSSENNILSAVAMPRISSFPQRRHRSQPTQSMIALHVHTLHTQQEPVPNPAEEFWQRTSGKAMGNQLSL